MAVSLFGLLNCTARAQDFAGNGLFGALLYDKPSGVAYAAVSQGNGTFQSPYPSSQFSANFDVVYAGYFYGHGRADLILYNSITAVSYIGSGNGDGTFSFQSLFWSPGYNFVECSDLNGDGKTDVVLYKSSDGTLYTALSDGVGGFTYKYTLISANVTFVRLADFTGDGKADLFIYNRTTGSGSLGVSDGIGGFTFYGLFLSPDYTWADIGDLNGDGKADVILYNAVSGNAATGISDGLGGFTFTPMPFSPGYTSVRLADYTGDGKADITVYNKNNGVGYFGVSTGTGTFNFQSLFWSPGYDNVVPEDINGDHKADIILYNSVTATEYAGISNGDGTFTYTYQYWGIGRMLARSVQPTAQAVSPTATPIFSPAVGTYPATQSVSITSATQGARIYYTTNGSTPTASSTLYTAPIAVSSTTTLKAIAYATGMLDSGVSTGVYTIGTPLTITGVTPSPAAAGTEVTITGTFVSPAAVWLGSTLASITSWNSTQVHAVVPANATSGTVRVQQGGLWSNALPFTVRTANILYTTPTSAAPGTLVTITGSGFNSPQGGQGSGQVWLGTANAVVQTWNDTQITAQVGSGSFSGNARVLQNGVMSNTVAFTVDSLHISRVEPPSALPGTSVTISGDGFGNSQGTGSVLLGSMNGLVTTWNNNQIVAKVAAGSLSGVVSIQQNGQWSNAPGFTVPVTGGNTVEPSALNLMIGETHTIQALNSNGQPATGLTWTSSNPSVVSLSTDNPPILTAVAAGHATITAGTATADVNVLTGELPLGTVIWSNPAGGSSEFEIVPAVPSVTGVADVFTRGDGMVRAITSEGITAWTANVGLATAIPDFQGGVILADYDANTIKKLDGITGQSLPQYSTGNIYSTADSAVNLSPAVWPVPHPDGTIFAAQTGRTAGTSVIGIDPTTGAQKFKIPLEDQPYVGVIPVAACSPATFYTEGRVTDIIVGGDGYAYVGYAYPELTRDCSVSGQYPVYLNAVHLKLLRVSSSGTYDRMTIRSVPAPYHSVWSGSYGNPFTAIITNADTGVLATWQIDGLVTNAPPQFGMALTTGTSLSAVSAPSLPGETNPIYPSLQMQDGSYVGFGSDSAGHNFMTAFDTGGNVRWTVGNESPWMATDNGGVVGSTGTSYDQSGRAVGQNANTTTYSWLGNAYRIGSVERVLLMPLWASSFAAFQFGNPSATKTYAPSLGTIFRAKVADIAKGYVGNAKDWTYSSGGSTTCNLFVRAVLVETSEATQQIVPFPVRPNLRWYQADYTHPFLAVDWANPGINGGCWKPLPGGPDASSPGDIIATGYPPNGNNGTGHVGIVVVPNAAAPDYKTASAASDPPYFWTAAQQQNFKQGTITLTDYGFRMPGYDAGHPQANQGLKADSHVRRFSCY